jgi:CPA2 family monovalent cation:H+ antiporter-2
MQDLSLIKLLAAAFAAAWALGLVTQKLRLSPIVGYLLAGVIIGPHTPGFVGDVSLAPQLAELGVILLMFGVGLHFHLKDLIAVRNIAIPGAIGQSLVATVFGAILFHLLGWKVSAGIVVGVAMAVASTVVLLRVLIDSNRLNSPAGHAAVGWLIVEDIITVIVLVLIPALAPINAVGELIPVEGSWGWVMPLLMALFKLLIMIGIVFVAGSRIVPWVLVQVAKTRSRELFTLTVLVLSIAVATASHAFFGASPALGAFLAGMVVAQSAVSQQAGADLLPLRDTFAVLFFVATGMLFDPRYLLEHPWLVLAGLGIVLIAKPLAAIVIVAALGHPAKTALTVAIGLAQIGEFSFIVAELGIKHHMLPDDGRNLLIACALVSITINPMLFGALKPLEAWLQARPRLWTIINGRYARRAAAGNARSVQVVREEEGELAIVVGYGPVGRQIDYILRSSGRTTVIIDLNMDAVAALNAQGRTAIYGDAMRPEILEQAGAERASHIVITTPSASEHQPLLTTAKALNPRVRVLIRTRYLREQEELRQLGADASVVDEIESAVALCELVLMETGADPERLGPEASRVRQELSSVSRPSHG